MIIVAQTIVALIALLSCATCSLANCDVRPAVKVLNVVRSVWRNFEFIANFAQKVLVPLVRLQGRLVIV